MKTNIFTIISAVASIAIFSFPAWGTDVEGIIDEDTTWDLDGSPYNIIATVQVDEGVTLTIEPGVVSIAALMATLSRFGEFWKL